MSCFVVESVLGDMSQIREWLLCDLGSESESRPLRVKFRGSRYSIAL